MYGHCSTRTRALTAHPHLHSAISLSRFLSFSRASSRSNVPSSGSYYERWRSGGVIVYVAEQRRHTQHRGIREKSEMTPRCAWRSRARQDLSASYRYWAMLKMLQNTSSLYTYMYIYIYMYMYTHTYLYTYICIYARPEPDNEALPPR